MKSRNLIRRLGFLMLIAAMVLSMALPCMAAEVSAISDARNGVVRIFAFNEEAGAAGTGTGFGVGKAGEETSYFVTNWHVITSSGKFDIGDMDVYIMLSDGAVQITPDGHWTNFDFSQMIKCEIMYSADKYPDVAILKAEKNVPGRVALPLRSAREVSVAEKVYTLGFPGVADIASTSEDGTSYKYASVDSVHINAGIVSKMAAFEMVGGTYCLEHDAHINSGNSGGPLVDENGNVVGINTYSLNADDFFEYSVYIDYAMTYLNQLGVRYDYVGGEPEEEFPVVPVAVGLGIVVVLVVILVILKVKRPRKQNLVDTGLRIQYDAGAMMANKRYVIDGVLRFGRAPDCNVRYPDNSPGISGHHCEILVDNGQVYIRDLNSTHGTFVNGSRIASNQQIPLAVGTKVCLGGMKESFRIEKSTKR